MSSTGVIEVLALLELLSRGGGVGPSPAPAPGPPGPPGPPAPYVDPGILPPPPAPGPAPAPSVTPAVVPAVVPSVPVPVGPIAPPGTLPPMPPWPSPAPATLPPFPGPGWTPDTPVTAVVAARAAYWNPQLWDYPTKTIRKPFVQEQLGGQWVTFAAAWHPGPSGPQTYMATEAWRLKSAPPVAPPTPAPIIPAVAPPPGVRPAPVSPYPGPGAYASNAAYIKRYQDALTYLSLTHQRPDWSPQGVDGKLGPKTTAAVKAFQSAHGLTTDGQCGAKTAAALDADMGYGAAPPAPAPMPAPAPPGVPPSPGIPPAAVQPYPGPGAYASNPAYIGRYQTSLTWLAHAMGAPTWDPGGIDGKLGPKTTAAVKAFQSAHGLTADGQCGAQTASAIDAAVSQLMQQQGAAA